MKINADFALFTWSCFTFASISTIDFRSGARKKKSGNNWNEKHICQQMNGENDGEVGIRAKFGRHTNEMIKEYFEYSLGQKKDNDKKYFEYSIGQKNYMIKDYFVCSFDQITEMKEKIKS